MAWELLKLFGLILAVTAVQIVVFIISILLGIECFADLYYKTGVLTVGRLVENMDDLVQWYPPFGALIVFLVPILLYSVIISIVLYILLTTVDRLIKPAKNGLY